MKALGKRLLVLAVLAGAVAICSSLWQAAVPGVNPPPSVAGWKLAAPVDCGKATQSEVQSFPETSQARRVCRAEYAGPSVVRLTLFDMPERPGATAFGAFQSWVSSGRGSGQMGFLKGRYFGLVESSQSDHAALEGFVEEIKKALP